MKFQVRDLTKCMPRTGFLKELPTDEAQIETPTVMLYTQGGSIPHITREVFRMFLEDNTYLLQIPLVSTYSFLDSMSSFDGKISEFIGMKDCVTCMSLQDPGNLTQSGHHFKDCIPIWTRNGKVMLNADSYMKAVEIFKPDIYYFLSDGDTNISSPTKRISKAVDRTILFFRECLAQHRKSAVLQKSFVMAAVAGGYCVRERERCIKEIEKDLEPIGGFLIDGLHNNGPEVEFLNFEELKAVVQLVINRLPADKLRVIHGCYNPVTIIKLAELGVDLFDTSYCHLVTERSAAITFSFDINDDANNTEFELNLRQEKYADDFGPLKEGCRCLTCSNYSKGYIHHLLSVQELLAPLLLSIHNIYHFNKFFGKIREGIKNNTLEELKAHISQQFDKHLRNSPRS